VARVWGFGGCLQPVSLHFGLKSLPLFFLQPLLRSFVLQPLGILSLSSRPFLGTLRPTDS